MASSENLLVQHLQEYRRKFYVNQIIRGSIFLFLLVSSLAFVAVMGEALISSSTGVRTGIMGALGLTFLGVLGYYVLWPAMKLFNLSKPISDYQIADLIKKHFPDVDDKLYNLLQLKEDSGDNSLVIAAINKKTEELAPVPFARAINLNVNLKYARFLLIPFLLFALVGWLSPETLKKGSQRLINFNKEFKEPLPFSISVVNAPQELIAGDNVKLKAEISGNVLPSDLYLYLKKDSESEFINYPMEKLRADQFQFEFSDIKEDFQFFVGNEVVKTEFYDVDVFRRPSIRDFRVVVDYPAYTGIPDDTLNENIGDFKVLRGSKVKWVLNPSDQVKEAAFVGKVKGAFANGKSGSLEFEKMVLEDEQYFINLISERGISNIDTVKYRLDVLQDRFPSVYVNNQNSNFEADFTMQMPLDFEVSDDYGFSKLSLFYRFTNSEDPDKEEAEYKEVKLDIKTKELLQHKALEVDLGMLGMEEGDEVEYFVKVWDNDYVAGPKASTSSVFTINFPSLDEKFEDVDEAQEKMLEKLAEVEKDVRQVKEGMKEFQEKMLNQKKLSFDDKQELKKLMEKQKDVREQVSELQKDFEKNKEFIENNELVSEQTLEKYEKLNELMEKLENPELDEMFKKMEEELEKMNPEDLKKMMEDVEFDEEELEKSIERTMELLKQLEIQQKSEELLSKMENLKQKQDLLNEKLEDTKPKNEEEMKEIAEKQEALEKEMEDIQKDMEELAEKKADSEQKDAEQMEDLQQDAEDTQQEMNEAGEQISQQKKNKGSESQKNASKKMEEMMKKMQSMMAQSQQKQDQANLESLRDLLENLLKLSFKQEDLRDEVKELRSNDPQIFVKEAEQKQVQDDMYMVKDSLDELAKKVFQIEKYVTDESGEILKSMKNAQRFLDDKRVPNTAKEQHNAMTHINNLANMLTDVMQQMQEAMKNSKPGSGKCTKPGAGMPNMQNLSKQQGQLNKMMQQMLQNGKGGMDPGKLAQMAKQQEAIRKALKEAHDGIKANGGKAVGDLQKIMNDMKDTETELMNKQLTQETLYRQQKIMNRLLDSFKSVREKNEFENSRESQTGRDLERESPDELDKDEYKNRLRQELLKSNQLEYSNDFIILIEKYFKLLEKENEQ